MSAWAILLGVVIAMALGILGALVIGAVVWFLFFVYDEVKEHLQLRKESTNA